MSEEFKVYWQMIRFIFCKDHSDRIVENGSEKVWMDVELDDCVSEESRSI